MTTQYTPILKLALPVTGELSGTWGDVVNDNITSMVEQAIAGLATISTWSANSHTLTTANGTTSESRCAMLVAQDGAGLAAAGEIVCPASSKLYVLKNDTSYAITLKTSAGTGVAVASGNTAFLFCDGTNVNACVTTIVDGRVTGNLTVDGNATINGNTTLGNATSDTITATARFASDLVPSTDNARDLGSSGNSWKDLYIDGTAYLALVDINGGTIDGVSIGASTAATIINVDNLRLDGNTISSTDTNGNVVIAPNGTGDVQLDADTVRVGDSGAAATLTSNGAGALTVTTGGAADLTLSTNSGTDSGTVVIANGANGNITLTPNGTGDVILSADRVQIGDSNTDTTLTTNGTGSLNLTTNNGTNSGTIQIAQGANGNITLTPNGTGSVSVPKLVWSNGTTTRVPYLTTGGQFTDSANLTFNGTDLTVSGAVNAGTINATTLDLTNLEVTNIKAKDGTASITIADSTGAVSFANNVTLGDASTDTVTVNGYMAIGGTPYSGIAAYIRTSGLQQTSQVAIQSSITANSTGTTALYGLLVANSTEAAAFNVGSVYNIRTNNVSLGAGSSATNQYGLYIPDLTSATNNYGITSLVSSGTNKWNIYASGTAKNLFAGQVVMTNNTSTEGSLYLQSTAPVIGFTDTNSFTDPADIVFVRAGTNNLQNQYYDASATTTYDLMSQSLTETVFNDSGADIDFRVESDTNTHALFVQGSDGAIGMGTSSPAVSGVEISRATGSATPTPVELRLSTTTSASDWSSTDPWGRLSFYNADTSSGGAKIQGAISMVATGSTGGLSNMLFQMATSTPSLETRMAIDVYGGLYTYPIVGSVAAVFNEDGVDADFRVESDAQTHMLFVDAGNNKVRIGDDTSTDGVLSLGISTESLVARIGGSLTGSDGVDKYIRFQSKTSGGSNRYVDLKLDVTNDRFDLYNPGPSGPTIPGISLLYAGGVVVNENGGDYDFRVESDTNTHALFVDAGNSRVGVNTSTPRDTFDVDLGTNSSFLVLQANRANAGTTSSLNAQLFTITVPYSNGGAGVGGTLRVFVNASAESGLNACANRSAVFDIVISRTGANSGGGNTDVDVQIAELTNATSSIGAPTISDIGLTASNPAASAASQTVDINITGTSSGSYIWRVYATIQYMGWENITFSNLT